MNTRRGSRGRRCPRCKIHHTMCFCDVIKEERIKARLSIIMHHREKHLTSNTANLTKLVIPECRIFLRGLLEKPFSVEHLELTPDETPLFLFPHEEAVDLDEEFMQEHAGEKFHLIVPDGTWSQAVKFYRREAGLEKVQCVKVPPGDPGRYRLRKSSDENRLSTYEAITRALAVLEQNEELKKNMEYIFDTMVTRVIRNRTAFEN